MVASTSCSDRPTRCTEPSGARAASIRYRPEPRRGRTVNGSPVAQRGPRRRRRPHVGRQAALLAVRRWSGQSTPSMTPRRRAEVGAAERRAGRRGQHRADGAGPPPTPSCWSTRSTRFALGGAGDDHRRRDQDERHHRHPGQETGPQRHLPLPERVPEPADGLDEAGLDAGRPSCAGSRCRSRRRRRRHRSRTATRGRGSAASTAPVPGWRAGSAAGCTRSARAGPRRRRAARCARRRPSRGRRTAAPRRRA